MTVLDFARQLEQSGFDFYSEMATRTGSEGVRRVFDLLATDQRLQLDRIRRLQERSEGMAMDGDGLLDRAVNIFERLRRNEGRLAIANDLDAYQLAIKAESYAVRQYRRALTRVRDAGLRRTLMRVLALDQRELGELEQLYDFVNAPTDSLEWGEFSNLDEFHNFGRYDDLRQGALEDPVIPEPIKH